MGVKTAMGVGTGRDVRVVVDVGIGMGVGVGVPGGCGHECAVNAGQVGDPVNQQDRS